ncbi:hypothetical protein GQ53DRAFT_755937 [Thozetella sp. PMI_491]|nr:hypothetical protein GQ53DRAFT_755937 [Thozetella sp. PMI_491]
MVTFGSAVRVIAQILLLAPSPSLAKCSSSSIDPRWAENEINFAASLGTRLTGSPSHNALIDHIESEVSALGFAVHSDNHTFTYYDGPSSPPALDIQGKKIHVSSHVPYSGSTDESGVTGPLINLYTHSSNGVPDWAAASGGIAITNVTNRALNLTAILQVWPGSPQWIKQGGTAYPGAQATVHDLTRAASAGVKAIVFVWENMTTGFAEGQYVPFLLLNQGIPAIFVQGQENAEALLSAAQNGLNATVVLNAKITSGKPTRTLYTVVEGTDLKNESMLIATHTDGTNVVEENGHIALLAKAQELAKNPPRRTTVLLWVTGHMRYPSFSPPPFRSVSRWMSDHPEYWAGTVSAGLSFGGQAKGVIASAVEHLGAIEWAQNTAADTYQSTNVTEPEYLFASTAALNDLVRKYWVGADPNVTRVTNPNTGATAQAGEGYPFYLFGIPNVSLVTNPSYLLQVFPTEFDQRQLIDNEALVRQVNSFLRLWHVMDTMPANAFGTIPTNGTQTPLTYTRSTSA